MPEQVSRRHEEGSPSESADGDSAGWFGALRPRLSLLPRRTPTPRRGVVRRVPLGTGFGVGWDEVEARCSCRSGGEAQWGRPCNGEWRVEPSTRRTSEGGEVGTAQFQSRPAEGGDAARRPPRVTESASAWAIGFKGVETLRGHRHIAGEPITAPSRFASNTSAPGSGRTMGIEL